MSEPHHLSKLRLDRYRAGELSPEEAAEVAARLDDRARTHLDGVEAAARDVPKLDLGALRARAAALPDASPTEVYETPDAAEPEVIDLAARRRRIVPLAVTGLLLAAGLLFAVIGGMRALDEPSGDHYAVRGDALSVYVAEGGELHPYQGTPVGAGDVLGFRVVRGPHRGVVLLSVDGTGLVSVFFPAEGTDPEPLEGGGPVELPGTVMLDDAPGPELFVAVFDRPADEAKALVQERYWTDGRTGLRALAARDDVAVAEVMRR